jgi:hypothetical protein
LVERSLPDTDAYRLYERKGERRDAMVENGGLNPKAFLDQYQPKSERWRLNPALTKCITRPKLCCGRHVSMGEFVDGDAEIRGMLAQEVPLIGVETVRHTLDEAGWTNEVKRLGPVKADTQQTVKAGKVVHMRVRDEDVAHAHQLPCLKCCDIAEVE